MALRGLSTHGDRGMCPPICIETNPIPYYLYRNRTMAGPMVPAVSRSPHRRWRAATSLAFGRRTASAPEVPKGTTCTKCATDRVPQKRPSE